MGAAMFSSFLARLIVAFINVAILIACSRYLGVSSRGEISIFLFGISLIQMASEVFTGYSIVHFLPKVHQRKVISAGYLFIFFASMITSGILYFSGKMLPGLAFETWLIALFVLVNTFHCIIILGREQLRLFNLVAIIQPALLLLGILGSVFLLNTYTFKAFAGPLILSFVLGSFVSGYLVLKTPVGKSTDPPPLKAIIKNGLQYQAMLLMHFICIRYTYFLLPDAQTVGLYASGTAIAESALLVSGSIAPLILTRVANNRENGENVLRTIQLSGVGVLFSLMVIVLLNVIPENWLLLVLGQGFIGIKQVIGWYAPSVIMLSLFIPLSQFFSAKGQQLLSLKCYTPGFLFTIAMAPYFTTHYGIAGAAINADISLFIVALGMLWSFKTSNHLQWHQLFIWPLKRQKDR